MAGTKNTAVTYLTKDVPGDAPLPVAWYFGVRDSAGTPSGPEQVFNAPTPLVTFTGIPAGTAYTVWAGQRDPAGAPIGDIVTSAPFDVVADVTISLVATLTITNG